jgi:uncharacterized SAM-dependent methyltransferase
LELIEKEGNMERDEIEKSVRVLVDKVDAGEQEIARLNATYNARAAALDAAHNALVEKIRRHVGGALAELGTGNIQAARITLRTFLEAVDAASMSAN